MHGRQLPGADARALEAGACVGMQLLSSLTFGRGTAFGAGNVSYCPERCAGDDVCGRLPCVCVHAVCCMWCLASVPFVGADLRWFCMCCLQRRMVCAPGFYASGVALSNVCGKRGRLQAVRPGECYGLPLVVLRTVGPESSRLLWRRVCRKRCCFLEAEA